MPSLHLWRPGLTALCAFASLIPMTAAAQTIRAVPGSSAGYLYFPATSGPSTGKVQLGIVKTGAFINYTVVYKKSGESTSTTVCPAGEITCSAMLPVGIVKLELQGQFAPGLPISGADWSGDCVTSGQAESCSVSLTAGTAREVRVQASCDGSPTTLGEGGNAIPVLCVGLASNGKELLLAAHQSLGSAKYNGPEKQVCGNTDREDGRANAEKLTGNCQSAAASYCTNLALGAHSWYLPAIDELAALRNPPSELKDQSVWSSTEYDRKYAYYYQLGKSSSSEKKYKYSYSQLCYTRITLGMN
ncbi:hypothetical protein [Comamonas composti]|uniref:hypothetical protein n=1 Tax=Comamonas composti TaxID=408558 RepID=UPI00041AEAB2|nr:hypothetical protein [Comamonas composti]